MPTFFTEPIYDGEGISFEDFALRCARAMGALITLRDEPFDAPIPDEFIPSDFYQKEIEALGVRFKETVSWTKEQAEAAAEAEYLEGMKIYEEYIKHVKDIRLGYETLLREVITWEPPTPEHTQLKLFMQTQLEKSIEYDCDDSMPPPSRLDGETYQLQRISDLLKGLLCCKQEQEEQILRAQDSTEWVRRLKESLGVGVTKDSVS